MSKFIKMPLIIALLAIFTLGFNSCRNDKSQIVYTLALSNDILKYVEPTITYNCTGGGTHTVTLKPEDFSTENVYDESRGTSISTPSYRIVLDFDDLDVTSSCEVSYRQIAEVPESGSFAYFELLIGQALSTHKKTVQASATLNFPSMPDYMDAKEFKNTIRVLTSTTTKLSIQIDKKGNITRLK